MFSNKRVNRRSFFKYSLAAAAGGGTLALLLPKVRLGERLLSVITSDTEKPFKKTIISMGTFVTISIYDSKQENLPFIINRAFEEFHLVDELMSSFSGDSEISSINRHSGNDAVAVNSLVCEVVTSAQSVSNRSNGIFDITILPLLKAFGFRTSTPRIPSDNELETARALVNYRTVFVDADSHSIGLKTSGQEMDLGGIAKGYAVDRAVAILKSYGIQRAVINAGGDIYAIGAPKDAEGWTIGVQHPYFPEKVAGTVFIKDQAIATSGNYENYVVINSEHYGHLFDPRTGKPANPILSATVTALTAMEADALATAAFLMGDNDGTAFIERQNHTSALFITPQPMRSINIKTTKNFPAFTA